ncbi:uncharacterized protein LOC118145716 [Callithrix jacchus]|uniref:uncharacterized protein LOC118145716 n=1 Tax=Callithrix jacchus TaxID=9483 RepID=UPI00159DB7FB|nr:uncharacterized protein LOC118145716 [Callithrix jacchus]
MRGLWPSFPDSRFVTRSSHLVARGGIQQPRDSPSPSFLSVPSADHGIKHPPLLLFSSGYFHLRTNEAGRRHQAGTQRQERSVHRPRPAFQNVPSRAAAPTRRGPRVLSQSDEGGVFPGLGHRSLHSAPEAGRAQGDTSTARLRGTWRQPAAAFPSPVGAGLPEAPTGTRSTRLRPAPPPGEPDLPLRRGECLGRSARRPGLNPPETATEAAPPPAPQEVGAALEPLRGDLKAPVAPILRTALAAALRRAEEQAAML